MSINEAIKTIQDLVIKELGSKYHVIVNTDGLVIERKGHPVSSKLVCVFRDGNIAPDESNIHCIKLVIKQYKLDEDVDELRKFIGQSYHANHNRRSLKVLLKYLNKAETSAKDLSEYLLERGME
jgi:hypothetical protein